MPAPLIIWGGVAVLGLFATGYAGRGIADALEEANTATKWAVVGGGLYVSYKALQSAGAIK